MHTWKCTRFPACLRCRESSIFVPLPRKVWEERPHGRHHPEQGVRMLDIIRGMCSKTFWNSRLTNGLTMLCVLSGGCARRPFGTRGSRTD